MRRVYERGRSTMQIRTYRAGDEVAQAELYNAAAAALPAFKPATAGEVVRRYPPTHPHATARFYAFEEAGGAVVGSPLFPPSGRVSYPWCLPGFEAARQPLFDAVLDAMTGRGHAEAWTAYRPDWSPVLEFFRERGFAPAREM